MLVSVLAVVLLGLNYRNVVCFNQHLKQLNEELIKTARFARQIQKTAEKRERQLRNRLSMADMGVLPDENVPLKTNPRAPILAMAYSRDGRLIASLTRDGFIKVWSAVHGQELVEFRIDGQVHNIRFSDDATQLICQMHVQDQADKDAILDIDGSHFDL